MLETAFTLCPFIAFLLGAVSALGLFRSRNWGLSLVCSALLVQVAVWTAYFLTGEVRQHGWTEDWGVALEAGFLRALFAVVPYTVIGAVCGGVIVGFVRLSVREEVEQTKEEAGHPSDLGGRAAGGRG